MRASTAVRIVVAATLSLISCASNPAPGAPEPAEIYGNAILQLSAQTHADGDRPLVFVAVRGEGTSVDLDVQAAILQRLQDDLEIRFVDTRAEALDDDSRVLDDGILVAIGPIITEGGHATLECDLETASSGTTSWRFTYRRTRDSWVPDQATPLG